MRLPASDERRLRRRRIAALAVAVAALVACEHPAPSAPAPLPVLARPTLTLRTHGRNARVLIPTAALTGQGGIPGVFVLQPAAPFPPVAAGADGKRLPQARFRMVKIGKTTGNRVEVLSGLAGDETLVLRDLSQVHDGSPIATER